MLGRELQVLSRFEVINSGFRNNCLAFALSTVLCKWRTTQGRPDRCGCGFRPSWRKKQWKLSAVPPIFSSCSDKDSVKLVVFSPSRLHDLNEAAQATTLEV